MQSRIQRAWGKCREVSGVAATRKIPTRLKVKIYKCAIRPYSAVWCGSFGALKGMKKDCWMPKKLECSDGPAISPYESIE